MGYWDATDNIIEMNGGRNPICPTCGQEMFPIDDHGRFMCGCPGTDLIASILGKPRSAAIPQIPAGTELTDEEKAQIYPMNRLNLPPTEEERKFFEEAFEELKGE